MSIEVSKLIDAIHSNRIRITDHADEEAFAYTLKLKEILRSVLNGEIIEEYPKDKPYPSCLVFGKLKMENRFIQFGLMMKIVNGQY